ncbi:Beta-glucuronidase [Colletotrichum siamense]|uniref:Beta-glucuronidase n=1 Tax=Colletotrichum siamense TaxID=690259 RepID=A0A9P5F2M0_COLSI|nr:Beta-glucuronidase [Colletotrichum siamense]KAF4866243.1 Beta-glucuronidase [Colletotrichum siamense]
MLSYASIVALGLINSASGAIWFTAPATVPQGSGIVVSPSFVSYSIELSYLPDYAGNKSVPNTFSENLLEQFRKFSGDDRPTIRVGGSSQDRVGYDPDLQVSRVLEGSGDLPARLTIGPTFFESLNTFTDTRFIYGLNMKRSVQNETHYQNMLDTVAAACKALSNNNLLGWSYGNEPNLYGFDNWYPADYTAAWLKGTRDAKKVLEDKCPDLADDDKFRWLTPSPSSLSSGHVNIPDIMEAGIDEDGSVYFLGAHSYMGNGREPVNKQAKLMNHTSVEGSINRHVSLMKKLVNYTQPYSISETNSLYGAGRAGVSNTFGAALWALDFSLHAAAKNITRLNFHMGRDYRYSAWQPVQTSKQDIGTKAPYYGNLATAAILGRLGKDKVQVANLPATGNGAESAYGIYHSGKLAKVAILNMAEYNFTASGNATETELNKAKRSNHNFSINLDSSFNGKTATVRRLIAPGADSITGITWDGYTFNYDVDNGKAVRVSNVTVGEEVAISGGKATLSIADSSAVVLEF